MTDGVFEFLNPIVEEKVCGCDGKANRECRYTQNDSKHNILNYPASSDLDDACTSRFDLTDDPPHFTITAANKLGLAPSLHLQHQKR